MAEAPVAYDTAVQLVRTKQLWIGTGDNHSSKFPSVASKFEIPAKKTIQATVTDCYFPEIFSGARSLGFYFSEELVDVP